MFSHTHVFNHIHDSQHLFDSISDEEMQQEQQPPSSQQINNEGIDMTNDSLSMSPSITYNTLSTMTKTTTATSTLAKNEPAYKPRTLQWNSLRYSILPAFPTSIYCDQPHLLLTSVPIHKLDSNQLARRKPNVYESTYLVDRKRHDIPSYFRHYYQSFMSSLIYKFNVDEAILDYNLYRFSKCFEKFADELIHRHKYHAEQFVLSDQQKLYAMEFYLQIDVDLFYMKTCSFRQAKPRSLDEGLFCINEPERKYGLSPCNNCSMCVPRYNLRCREQLGSMIQFSPKYGFGFYNGYQTILNCPADCSTNNLVYVMVCPCGEFEYIGETSQRLNDRLRYHRQHFNRIFHEFLIGERNVRLTRTQEKDQETLVKDRMRLYRHAVRCPSAIQIFLNFNPIYWCFVPYSMMETEVLHQKHIELPSSLILLDTFNPTSIGSKDRQAIPATSNTRSDENVRSCMRNLPYIPPGYKFSIQQRTQQFLYFKHQQDINHKQNPTMDLFNVAIVAVLPEDASETVRRFVEALFITHAETKLNTSGRLILNSLLDNDNDNNNDDDDNNNNNNNPDDLGLCDPTTISPMSLEGKEVLDRGEWCLNLMFPHHKR